MYAVTVTYSLRLGGLSLALQAAIGEFAELPGELDVGLPSAGTRGG